MRARRRNPVPAGLDPGSDDPFGESVPSWAPPPPPLAPLGAPAPDALYAAEVYGSNLGMLRSALESLKTRAAKLHLPQVSYEIGAPHRVWLDERVVAVPAASGGGEVRVPGRWEQSFPVRVWGQIPTLAGWRLLGVISPLLSPTGESLNLLTPVPSAPPGVIERYRHSDLVCDHCGYVRQRKETYVVQHENGETRQVGSGCMKDFLGGRSIGELLSWSELDHQVFQLMRDAAAEEGDFSFGAQLRHGRLMREYLAAVAAAIRSHGWLSKSRAETRGGTPTSVRASAIMREREGKSYAPPDPRRDWKLYRPTRGTMAGQDPIHEEDWSAADRVIVDLPAYLAQKRAAGHTLSEYEQNLDAVMASAIVTSRAEGTAASAFAYLQRAAMDAEREAQRLAAQAMGPAAYFGEVGKRVTFPAQLVRSFHYQGGYGPGTGMVFVTPEGQNLMWFASGTKNERPGPYTLTATIGGHETDKRSGLPTTYLKRVAFVDASELLPKVKGQKKPPKPGSKADLVERALSYPPESWAAVQWTFKGAKEAKAFSRPILQDLVDRLESAVRAGRIQPPTTERESGERFKALELRRPGEVAPAIGSFERFRGLELDEPSSVGESAAGAERFRGLELD